MFPNNMDKFYFSIAKCMQSKVLSTNTLEIYGYI